MLKFGAEQQASSRKSGWRLLFSLPGVLTDRQSAVKVCASYREPDWRLVPGQECLQVSREGLGNFTDDVVGLGLFKGTQKD